VTLQRPHAVDEQSQLRQRGVFLILHGRRRTLA
jgi:hypothetical protein